MNKQEKEPAHHRSRVFEKSLGKHVACVRLGGGEQSLNPQENLGNSWWSWENLTSDN